MDLREYLTARRITMMAFGEKIGRAQSIISRICNRKHRADPTTALRIVVATRGEVSLDDIYDTPAKYRRL